jgi:hypothetical protein
MESYGAVANGIMFFYRSFQTAIDSGAHQHPAVGVEIEPIDRRTHRQQDQFVDSRVVKYNAAYNAKKPRVRAGLLS